METTTSHPSKDIDSPENGNFNHVQMRWRVLWLFGWVFMKYILAKFWGILHEQVVETLIFDLCAKAIEGNSILVMRVKQRAVRYLSGLCIHLLKVTVKWRQFKNWAYVPGKIGHILLWKRYEMCNHGIRGRAMIFLIWVFFLILYESHSSAMLVIEGTVPEPPCWMGV